MDQQDWFSRHKLITSTHKIKFFLYYKKLKYLNYNKSTITNTCKVILESAVKLQCEAYKYMIHGLISVVNRFYNL